MSDDDGAVKEAGAAVRYWLTTETGSILLPKGESVLGRSPDCELCIEDERMSRKHLLFVVEGGVATVQDLGSSNGTYLDGERLRRSAKLFGGEVLRVGTRHFQVGVGTAPPRFRADTSPAAPRSKRGDGRTDASDLTPRVDTSSMSAFMRAAVTGRTPAGELLDEQVLEPMLGMVREEIDATGTVEGGMAQKAAETALALAVARRSPQWIDFVIDLYTKLGVAMPDRVLDGLEVANWQVDGANAEALARYAALLEQKLDERDVRGQASRLRVEEQARATSRRSKR